MNMGLQPRSSDLCQGQSVEHLFYYWSRGAGVLGSNGERLYLPIGTYIRQLWTTSRNKDVKNLYKLLANQMQQYTKKIS